MATPATGSTAAGTITLVVGNVRVIGVDGVARAAKVGDKVFAREVIETGADGIIQVQLDGGRFLDVGRDSKFALSSEILAEASAGTPAPAAPPVTTPAGAEQDAAALQKAIAAGADPSQVAAATAAGGAPAAGGAGADGGGGTPVVIGQSDATGEVTSGFPTQPASIAFPIIEPQLLPEEVAPAVSVTIQPQPEDGVTVSGNAASVIEGTSDTGATKTVNFVITLNEAFDTDVEVTYVIQPGTALTPEDFGGVLTATIVIPAGETEFIVPVDIVQDHLVEADQNFTIVLTDAVNAEIDPSASSAVVTIINDDTAPTAFDDTNWTQEDSETNNVASGNVLENQPHVGAPSGGFSDKADVDIDGQEVLTVMAVDGESGNVGATLQGQYGTLVLNGDGTYTYTLNSGLPAIQHLDDGQKLSENFGYTITDGFNDPSSATLTITIFGSNDGPTITTNPGNPGGASDVVYEAGLGTGSGVGPTTTLVEGTFRVSDIDGVDDIKSVTIEGITILIGDLGNNNPIEGEHGTLTVTGYNSVTGVATYTYELTSETTDAGGKETDVFTLTTSDGDADSAPANITIEIVDDKPIARDDSNSMTEDNVSVSGNVRDEGPGADTRGADRPATVTGGTFEGEFGTLVLGGNGNYTYTLNANLQGLDTGQTRVEEFPYVLIDADGDSSNAVLTITITGTNDGPVAVADTNWVEEDHEVNSTASGNVLETIDHDRGELQFGDAADTDVDGENLTVTSVTKGGTSITPDANGEVIQGTYGTLLIKTDGSYTYTLNNSLQVVQDLVQGQTITDAFGYTASDGDATDNSTLIITIFGSNDGPQITVRTDGEIFARGAEATVHESDLSVGSDPSGNGEFTTGQFKVADSDGLQDIESVTINGQTISIADLLAATVSDPVEVDGDFGVMRITSFSNGIASFTYELEDVTTDVANQAETDVFTLTTTDGESTSSPATVTIDIVDDVPTARADADSVTEGADATGNVITGAGTAGGAGGAGADTAGADGFGASAVIGVAAGNDASSPVSGQVGVQVVGLYGTLTLNANGGYTYEANPNAVQSDQQDVFVYTVVDGDGDKSTTTLTINVNNVTVQATDTEALVNEAGLPAIGSNAASNSEVFNGAITPSGGTGPYTFTLNESANGDFGNLVLNADGTYTYTLDTTFDGPTANNGTNTEQNKDTFSYTVTDANGNTTTGVINVDIIDDVPTARADADSVTEGADATGNVITGAGTAGGAGGAGADTAGADGFGASAVVGVAAGDDTSSPVSGQVGVQVAGLYGTLTLNANGSYTYEADPDAVTGNEQDVFVYTVVDGDGDKSTTTLTINVNNVTVQATDTEALVNEAGLPAIGSNAASNSEVFNGAITPSGGTGPYTFTLNESANGDFGNLVLNADGTYTYTLDTTFDGPTANNGTNTEQNKDTFSYTVTDANGNTTTGVINVDIIDDVPTARADADSVTEGADATGNVITGAGTAGGAGGAGADTAGADGFGASAVVGVAAGDDTSSPVSGQVGVQVAGLYGTLTLNANGSYTYEADPDAVTGNEQDVFVYTVVDGDGDKSTTTLTINVNNVTVQATDTEALVNEAGLPAIGSNAASNSEVFNGAITPSGGTGPYTFTLNESANGDFGNLVLNADGTYTYTLDTTFDGPTANNGTNTEQNKDTFSYTVTDANGNTTTGVINVDIIDDVPTAVADALQTVAEDAVGTIGGNVRTNDTQGADTATVTHINLGGGFVAISTGTPLGGGVFQFATANGTYTISGTGAWTFDPNANLNNASGISAGFTYRITDGDGDISEAVQPITVTDGAVPTVGAPITLTLDDQNLADESMPANPDFVSNSITFTPGSDAITSIVFSNSVASLGGGLTWTRVSGAQIVGKDGAVTIVTLDLTLVGNVATVKATLNDNYDSHPGINLDDLQALGSVGVVATDTDGDTATGTVNVAVSDDVPTVSVGDTFVHNTDNSSNTGTQSFNFGADGQALTGPLLLTATSGLPAGFSLVQTAPNTWKAVLGDDAADSDPLTDLFVVVMNPAQGTYTFTLLNDEPPVSVNVDIDSSLSTGTWFDVNGNPTANAGDVYTAVIEPTGNNPYRITASGVSEGVAAEIAVGNNTIGVGGDDVLHSSNDDVFNLSFENTTGQQTTLETVVMTLQHFNANQESFEITISGTDTNGNPHSVTYLENTAGVSIVDGVADSDVVTIDVSGFGSISQISTTATEGVVKVVDFDLGFTVDQNVGDYSYGFLATAKDGDLDTASDAFTVTVLAGTAGNDSLITGTLNDTVSGGAGNDTISTGAGNDILVGGSGNDILTGGAGTDTFKWNAGDGGAPAPVDSVIGFTQAPGDKLDLSELLVGEHANAGSLSAYLHFTAAGGNTTVEIKSTGGGAIDQKIVLQGVDLTSGGTLNDSQIIQNLLTAGKLQTDA